MKTTQFLLAGLIVLKLATSAFAVETPRQAVGDGRIRFVNYQPFNVVRIIGTLRSSVQVEFAADEDIAHVALGNTVAWEIAPAGNILFLKPRESQPPTNLSVVTTRRDGTNRSYQIELSIRDGSVSPSPDTVFLVKYRYPADDDEKRRREAAQRGATAKAGAASALLAADEANGPRNWRYTVQGSEAIEPASVYDNGKLTTLTFAGNMEIPAIFLVNTDGTESLVPKSTESGRILIHAIAAKFVLRRGNDVLCLFNEGYSAEGVDPGTKTTSPEVERIIAGQALSDPTALAPLPKLDQGSMGGKP